ncbi:thioredoxin [Fibrobacter sp. UWH3]|nr:thioredoxin [Fibrobacter sp. UWH3]OWV16597.1 thioredoxin [Fibrobacter sp. UWH1]
MMRLLFLILFAAVCAFADPQEPKSLVHWMGYSEAFALAKSKPKLVFVDLYADWCVPCRVMDKNVYMNPMVADALNRYFYPVKLDADSQDSIMCDGQKNTVQRCYFDVWELNALPAFVLVAPKGMSILTVTDSMSPQEMLELLLKFLEKEKEWISR